MSIVNYPIFAGANNSSGGRSGLLPAPPFGFKYRGLSSGGSFSNVKYFPRAKISTQLAGSFVSNSGLSLNATATLTANIRDFSLIFMPQSGNINKLIFAVSSPAPASSININLALWKINNIGDPSDYVIGGNGGTGTTSNTNVEISVSNTSIERGFYYFSFTSQSTSSGNVVANPASVQALYMRPRGVKVLSSGTGNLSTNNATAPSYTCTTSYDQTNHESTFSYDSTSLKSLGVKYA